MLSVIMLNVMLNLRHKINTNIQWNNTFLIVIDCRGRHLKEITIHNSTESICNKNLCFNEQKCIF
jgi:hypothetical protein